MKTALALLLLALPAAAAEEVSFKLTLPKGEVKLAAPFKLHLQATYPAHYSIRPDTAAAGGEEFEVLSFSRLNSAAAGGAKIDTFEIAAKAFALGQSTFPAVTWELYAADKPSLQAKSPPFLVDIKPIFEKTEGDIKDIYPPFRYIPWLWLLAGLLAVLLAVFLSRRFRPAGAAGAAYADWKDPRTPYQRARERLERLAASPLAAAGKMRELYTGFTYVLRLYLREEFAIDAELMTTADLTRELKRTGADVKTTLRAREFLHKADLVKFAKLHPGDAAADAANLLELLGDFARAAENARTVVDKVVTTAQSQSGYKP